MKILRIIILFIPLLVIALFVYPPKYLQELLIEGPYLSNLLGKLEQDLQAKMNQNKYYADQKMKDCSWLFDRGSNQTFPQSLIEDQGIMKELCEPNIDHIPDIIIITIILPNEASDISAKVDKIRKKLIKQSPHSINIKIQNIKLSAFPQQIKNKLKLYEYRQSISQHFLKTRHMLHCRYTHKPCQNYVIYIHDNEQLSENYFEYQGVYMTSMSNIGNMISVIIGLQPFTHFEESFENWRRYTLMKKLMAIRKQIKYLKYTINSHSYALPDVNMILNLDQEVRKWDSGSHIGLWKRTLSPGEMNIFPTEYKLGVFLPIILVLVLMPLTGLMR